MTHRPDDLEPGETTRERDPLPGDDEVKKEDVEKDPGAEDTPEEQSEESFPASDPPAW